MPITLFQNGREFTENGPELWKCWNTWDAKLSVFIGFSQKSMLHPFRITPVLEQRDATRVNHATLFAASLSPRTKFHENLR